MADNPSMTLSTPITAASSTALDRVRSARAAIYAAGHAQGDSGHRTPLWPAGLTQDAADFLRDLVIRERARTALEVGTGLGLSSLATLEGLLTNAPDARLTTIDPAPEWCHNAGLRTLENSGGFDHITFIKKYSHIALPALLDADDRFDFAFIDGAHQFDGVLLDLFFALRLVKTNGLIVLDDHWMPAIQTVLAYATTNLGLTLELFDPAGPGKRLVALRNSDAPHQRAWDHFAPFSRADLPAYPWRR